MSKRKAVALSEKLTMIEDVKKGAKQKDVAKKFGTSEKTLSQILRSEDKILKFAKESSNRNLNELKRIKYGNKNDAVQWKDVLNWVPPSEEKKIYGFIPKDTLIDLEDIKTRTKLRTNKQQLQRFIELLQSNVEVARATSLKHEAIYKWDEFTLQLNKLGPPKKDWEQWFRVWSELKAMVRKKNKKACQPPTKTLPNGTLIKHVVQFTELEKTVIEILGLDKDENESGNQEIKTSRSNFSITLDGTGDDDVSFEPANKRIKYNTYESVTKQSSTESEEEPSTSNPSTQTVPRLKELEEASTEINFEEEEIDYEDTVSVYSLVEDDIKFEETDFDEMTQFNTNESLNKQTDEQPIIKTEPEDHEVEEVLHQLSTYIKTEPIEQDPEEEEPSISLRPETEEKQVEKEQPLTTFIKTEP